MTLIRPEIPEDYSAIAEVLATAFRGDDEVRLMEELRHCGDLMLSLVAVEDGEIVGHIAFSRLLVTTTCLEYEAMALAPLAVMPTHHRRGIGSQLVRAALERFPNDLVVVLGDPKYYGRFGFTPNPNLRCTFSGPELMSNLPHEGELTYARGFSLWT